MITINLEFPQRAKLAQIADLHSGGSLSEVWICHRLAGLLLPQEIKDAVGLTEVLVHDRQAWKWDHEKASAVSTALSLEDADAAALLALMRKTTTFVPRDDAEWTQRVVEELSKK